MYGCGSNTKRLGENLRLRIEREKKREREGKSSMQRIEIRGKEEFRNRDLDVGV